MTVQEAETTSEANNCYNFRNSYLLSYEISHD